MTDPNTPPIITHVFLMGVGSIRLTLENGVSHEFDSRQAQHVEFAGLGKIEIISETIEPGIEIIGLNGWGSMRSEDRMKFSIGIAREGGDITWSARQGVVWDDFNGYRF